MTTSRAWLVLFDQAEIERRYQWPVSVERVLADHRAAVAAVPISEAKDTSGSTIAAPAADTQAGEACIVGPHKEARHTGSLHLGQKQFSGPPSSCLLQRSCMKTIKLKNRSLGASGGPHSPCAAPFVEAPK